MPDLKEKLVELIDEKQIWGIDQEQPRKHDVMLLENEELADHLIANGVTIQKWISFDEVKPADGQWVLSIDSLGEMETMYYDKNWENCLCKFGGNLKIFNITHWMPLPQPPKGE